MYKIVLTAFTLTDSLETSKAKVTVEMPQSSVKMRAATQLPVIGPDDDLAGMLLQVKLFLNIVNKEELIVRCNSL